MPKRKVHGSWKDGSDIFRNKEGYYIVKFNKKTKKDVKKYLKAWNTKSNKECKPDKVLNPLTKRCVKNCPKGFIIRNSYLRNLKGTKTLVPAKCIKSQGLPGKTSNRYLGKNKGIGKLKKGELSKHGYSNIKNLSKIKRHKFLDSAIKEYGSSKILKS